MENEREEEENRHEVPKKAERSSFGGGDAAYVGAASGRGVLRGAAF